jgi:hypothetical protein
MGHDKCNNLKQLLPTLTKPVCTGSTQQLKPETTKKKRTFNYTTRYVSFIFNFDTRQIKKIECGTQIEVSKCTLHGINNAYKTLTNNYLLTDEYYVVCPIYFSKSSKRMLDTQLSVTGKCQYGENEVFGTIREIQEELGITCNINKIACCTSRNSTTKTETTFIADVTDGKYFDPKRDCVTKNRDDKTKRIQVVVYGKINNLLNMYSNILNRPESNDIETIRHIRILSLKEFI